jgi:cell division protein FtsI (penicillin-binding protein 3)
VAVTPLQLTTAFSALANGGMLVRPHLLKAVISGAEVVQQTAPVHVRRVISESTARQVTHILQGAVLRGTGKAATVDGYTVAGKTGTAQKFDAAVGKYSSQKSIASFVGYLPAEQPRATILVSLDEPQVGPASGGIAAAPVFSAIAQQTMRYLRVPPAGSAARTSETAVTRLTGSSTGAGVVTLSAGNFVENVREMMRDMADQMASYVRGRFLTVDAKEARKSRRRAEPADR